MIALMVMLVAKLVGAIVLFRKGTRGTIPIAVARYR